MGLDLEFCGAGAREQRIYHSVVKLAVVELLRQAEAGLDEPGPHSTLVCDGVTCRAIFPSSGPALAGICAWCWSCLE